MRIRLDVNGRTHEVEVRSGLTLLSALRDDLGLTGTRFGSGHGACGACVVLVPIVHARYTCRVETAAGCRWLANQAPARSATRSSVPGSSKRCVAPGTISSETSPRICVFASRFI